MNQPRKPSKTPSRARTNSKTNNKAGNESRHAPRPSVTSVKPETVESKGRIGTRVRLLDAARTVFEARGFPDTRVDDICAEAGLAHGTFYIYFQTKEEIFYTLVDRLVTNRLAITTVPADYEGNVADRFAYTLHQYFADILSQGQFGRCIEQVVTFDDHMREVRLQIRRDFSHRVQRGIERLQQRGVADPDVPAALTAEAIVSMISNFSYVNITLGEKRDLDFDQIIDTFTDIWARAIGLDFTKLDDHRLSENQHKSPT